MEILGVIVSILLGISVISGLIKEGTIGGCFGIFLILILIIIVAVIGFVVFLFTIGGAVL